MSARMPTILDERPDEALDVHEWLEHVNEGIDISRLESSPLAAVCTSAVDPLEIAVALEVAGVSHAVATDRYNRADVFALARTLWERTPMRPAAATPIELPRSGDRRDLGRGVLYALPALMLLAITVAFDLELKRWVLPLAITWGWGLGQVASFAGYKVHGTDPTHEATVMGRVALGAVMSTVLVSTVATIITGGGLVGVAASTTLVAYIVASAVLLVRGEEQWLALLLLPGALASIVVLAVTRESMVSQIVAVVLIGASFVAIVYRALGKARIFEKTGAGRFVARDLLIGSGHLVHGVICGLAVSLVMIPIGHTSPEGDFGRMLLPLPLLASLGVMEWQLHTFRNRIAKLTQSLESVHEFAVHAWYVFCRSLTICTATMVLGAAAVIVAVRIDGGEAPIALLALQCALGAVFFADLILMLLDRLDLDLRAWLTGIAGGSIALVGGIVLTGTETRSALLVAAGLLVALVLVSLLISTRKVVSAAMNH